MMKLTFTFFPAAAGENNGSGVVSASGGRTIPQLSLALMCRTSTYCEARITGLEI
jgi:hypothetical protein